MDLPVALYGNRWCDGVGLPQYYILSPGMPFWASHDTVCKAPARGLRAQYKKSLKASLGISVTLYVNLRHGGMGLTWNYILSVVALIWASCGTTF